MSPWQTSVEGLSTSKWSIWCRILKQIARHTWVHLFSTAALLIRSIFKDQPPSPLPTSPPQPVAARRYFAEILPPPQTGTTAAGIRLDGLNILKDPQIHFKAYVYSVRGQVVQLLFKTLANELNKTSLILNKFFVGLHTGGNCCHLSSNAYHASCCCAICSVVVPFILEVGFPFCCGYESDSNSISCSKLWNTLCYRLNMYVP